MSVADCSFDADCFGADEPGTQCSSLGPPLGCTRLVLKLAARRVRSKDGLSEPEAPEKHQAGVKELAEPIKANEADDSGTKQHGKNNDKRASCRGAQQRRPGADLD